MEEKVWNAMKAVNEKLLDYEGENFFDAGLLDSLQVVSLVVGLENEFDIEIDADYLREENFKSKAAILDMMKKILGSV